MNSDVPVRSNKHMIAPFWEWITNLYCMEWNHTASIRLERRWQHFHFSGKNVLVCSLQSSLISLIHSTLQRNAATLRKVLAPFAFSHVIDSCSLFISFHIFSFLLDFIANSCWVFSKITILLGLAGYRSSVPS